MFLKKWFHTLQIYSMKGKRFIRMTLLYKEIKKFQEQDRFLYNGNKLLSEIALTFDDGPDPQYTLQILDVLQKYGVKATFFCTGEHSVAYPDVLRCVHEAGHVIGNHSWGHRDMGLLPAEHVLPEITRASDAIREITGVAPTLFRPPFGSLSSHVLTQLQQLNLTTVLWNAGEEARDWSSPGVDFIVSRILKKVGNGTIVLMHDSGGDRSQTVAALPIVIERLQSKGFKFVTIQQMTENLHVSSQPVYASALF